MVTERLPGDDKSAGIGESVHAFDSFTLTILCPHSSARSIY
jgi:hypothetical protein